MLSERALKEVPSDSCHRVSSPVPCCICDVMPLGVLWVWLYNVVFSCDVMPLGVVWVWLYHVVFSCDVMPLGVVWAWLYQRQCDCSEWD